MPNSSALLRTIAVVGDATSVFWLLFGEHKLAGPGFAHRGFPTHLRDYIANRAVSFYRPVLAGLMLPHAIVFRWVVGVVELRVGISFFVGLFVRPACILGILLFAEYAAGQSLGTGPRGSGLALFRCRARPSSTVAAANGCVRGRWGTSLGAGPAPSIDFVAVAVKS